MAASRGQKGGFAIVESASRLPAHLPLYGTLSTGGFGFYWQKLQCERRSSLPERRGNPGEGRRENDDVWGSG